MHGDPRSGKHERCGQFAHVALQTADTIGGHHIGHHQDICWLAVHAGSYEALPPASRGPCSCTRLRVGGGAPERASRLKTTAMSRRLAPNRVADGRADDHSDRRNSVTTVSTRILRSRPSDQWEM